MQIKWLIEKDVFRENEERLSKEITAQGHAATSVGYVPFQSGKYAQLLAFDDVDRDGQFFKETRVITVEQAKQIVTFVDLWKDKVELNLCQLRSRNIS